MRLLQDLALTEKKDDLSRLPKDVMTAIKSNIRKGAEDLEQKWANALELVHKAYDVEGVQRPDPSMETAWKQYEENLQYAVNQLADNRGMDDDWRMSSSMFHEARQRRHKFRVLVDNDDPVVVEARNFDEIVEGVSKQTSYDVLVEKNSPNQITMKFARFGIKKNHSVKVNRIG